MAVNIGEWLNLGQQKIKDVAEYNPVGVNGGSGLFSLLTVVFKNIYTLVAIILLIMIFIGGLGMIINAGDAEKQKQSSNTLGSAAAGFLIMFAAYWIIKIIEIITGTIIISL